MKVKTEVFNTRNTSIAQEHKSKKEAVTYIMGALKNGAYSAVIEDKNGNWEQWAIRDGETKLIGMSFNPRKEYANHFNN